MKTYVILLLVTFSLGKNLAQPDVKSVRDRLLTGLNTFKEQSWDSTTKINQPYTISFSEIADTTFQKTWTTSLQMENGDSILFRFDKVKDKIKNGIFFNSNAILPDTFKKSDDCISIWNEQHSPDLASISVVHKSELAAMRIVTFGLYYKECVGSFCHIPSHRNIIFIDKNNNTANLYSIDCPTGTSFYFDSLGNALVQVTFWIRDHEEFGKHYQIAGDTTLWEEAYYFFRKSDNSFHALSDSCKPNLMYFNILNSTTGNYKEKLLEYNLPLLPFHKKIEDILKNEN